MAKYVPPHLRGNGGGSEPPAPPRASNRQTGNNIMGGGAPNNNMGSRGNNPGFGQDREFGRRNDAPFGSRGGSGGRWDRLDAPMQPRPLLAKSHEQSSNESKASWSKIHAKTRGPARFSEDDGTNSGAQSSLGQDGAGESSSRGEGAKEDVKSELTPEEAAKEREEAEKERHPDMHSEETVALSEFFEENSDTFRTWARVRSEGYSNKHISHFFERKKSTRDSGAKRAGAYHGAEIKPIFTQFYKYAVDIDNGLAYTERMIDIAESQGNAWFIDFGYAPGGMSDLLLNSHEKIHGCGVTLDPGDGGNIYVEALDRHPRFHPYIGDVIDMAREDLDLQKAAGLPEDFEGFDFVIVGITIHQEWEGPNMNELKDLLHFSQLFFAYKYLKPGGMVMQRMHMSVRLVDAHMLSLLLSSFAIEKFSGLKVGQRRLEARLNEVAARQKARAEEAEAVKAKREQEKQKMSGLSKLEMLAAKMEADDAAQSEAAQSELTAYAWNHLDRTAVASKPFSTFSMRKTYWVIYHGFHCKDEDRKAVLDRLKILVQPDLFAYGYDAENEKFNKPILMDMNIHDLLEKYGKSMIAVLESVWLKQVEALEGFMAGQTDKMCRDGIACRRRHCNMAHRPSDMIPSVLDALNAVDLRARPRLQELGLQ
mmetsp:Transcript_19953/g.39177  ORF Transcript_19953/g.39177 Transcript_19953/m.39177 type:complete len:651 (-) Transcript_19953:49-2001(-)